MNTSTTFAADSNVAFVPAATAESAPIVFVVDDDVWVRESLESLIADAGWRPAIFASAEAFLASSRESCPGCLVLDVNLPDLSGLELQQHLADDTTLPIIFISGHGNIPMTVRAIKAGAVEFLTKPYCPDALLSAIQAAIERSRAALDDQADLQGLRDRYESLSLRERQVMGLVVRGHLNKQVGGDLNISEITVKAHRGRMMRKMEARSLAELVNMAARLGLATAGKS